jgi:uncharacterized RDD family membrane protein YckC
MEPMPADAMHERESSSRSPPPTQAGTPKSADPSLQQTQLTLQRPTELPQAAPTVDARPRGSRPLPPSALTTSTVTQPEVENPFDEARAPISPLDPEPKTRNDRPSSRPKPGPDLAGEVKRLHAEPHEHQTKPRAEAAAGGPMVEVLAHPPPALHRLGAWTIDALVLAAVDAIIAMGVLALGRAPPLPSGLGVLDKLAVRVHDSGRLVAAIVVLALGLAAAYTTLFAVAWSGRTIGRRLFGLHLVDAHGSPPSPLRALARACCALLSFALFGTGFWLGLFSAKGRTLHDLLCSTFVVRLGPSRT